MCHWAIGTDTAGSLRIPASLCGIVSIKPTYDSVSVEGVLPLSRSLDTVGPMARDVGTAAIALSMMTGGRVSVSPPGAVPVTEVRIGRAPDDWVVGLDDATARAWMAVAADFPELEIPDRPRASEICTTISMYEASRFHQKWLEEQPEAYGDEDVRRRLELGLQISRKAYEQAIRERASLADEFDQALAGWDALLAPATAMVAQPIDGGPDVREPMTRFTRPFAATGQPVVTIPAPVSGLPVGIQVVGRRNDDAAPIRAAMALEAQWR
jgi:aspartyl-tRNA(Asn)/glutamyl-tRNA(Gln) amidotransferase subunit A